MLVFTSITHTNQEKVCIRTKFSNHYFSFGWCFYKEALRRVISSVQTSMGFFRASVHETSRIFFYCQSNI